MIKKSFKDFILMLEGNSPEQSSLDNDTLENNTGLWIKNKEFLHKFHGALEELPSDSWTVIAKSRGRKTLNSEDAWFEINNALKNFELTWEDVKANKEVILSNIDCYSSLNAYVDIILYNLDNNYAVSGWTEVKENSDVLIKYRYGYHQTTYGIIFLKRYFGSVDEFIDHLVLNLLDIFIEDSKCVGYRYQEDVSKEIKDSALTSWNGGILSIKFEYFYLIVCPHFPKIHIVEGINLEKFKAFFINWVYYLNPKLDIDDDDDLLKINFNCDL